MNGQTATPLDLAGISLSGHNAIDASAGTGKTYAISRLYLRLVLEREGSGDEIVDRTLVVTFTKAATAELRRRIRDTLVEARTVLSRRLDAGEEAVVEGAGVDAVLAKVRADDLPDAIRRLDQAVAGFDRAAIFTIHSFCQRALSESAFESGRLFDCELEADDRAALGEVVDDFWRRRVATVDRDFAEYLRAKSVLRDPASLLQQLRRHVGMRGLEVLPEGPPDLGPLRQAASESWEESAREAFRLFEKEAVIDGTDVGVPGRCELKKTSFTEPTRKKILDAINRMVLGSEVEPDLVKSLKKLDRRDVLERVKEGSLPALPFFDHCSNLVRQAELVADPFRFREIELRTDALRWANAEVRRRRDRRAVQSYDDLLRNLLDSLEGPGGDRLAARLRDRYPVALIDEFQDTDPVQFRIFERVYPPGSGAGPLFFVGDPKQAIYAFRRADVFAYIEARSKADRRYSLATNRRSTPPLVRGANAIFDVPAPFIIEGVPAGAVGSIDDDERGGLVTPGDDAPPLRISFFRRGADGSLSKDEARRIATRDTVRRIVGLLRPDSGARIEGGRRPGPVKGGSIAVLVRTNRQAMQIRKALAAAGIPSVLAVQSSVFGTDVAADLELVLRAVRDPSDERTMGAAFATPLCGVSGEDVDLARTTPGSKAATDWEARVQRFRDYNRRWAGRGFVEMFRDLVEGEGMAERLLGGPEGERRLTDLMHLGECLAAESASGRRRIEALMNWFSEARRGAEDDEMTEDDGRRMRLESDDDLVQIATLHKSKGLEYDIVFLPFAWDGKLWAGEKSSPVLFHAQGEGGLEVRLDFGSVDYASNRELARREERAEILRLFYVGVTRARHRCHVVWGSTRDAESSAPAWLFHRRNPDAPIGELDVAFKTRSDDDLWQDLLAIRDRAPESIGLDEIEPGEPVGRLAPVAPSRGGLAVREWKAGHAPRASRILSFTALSTQRTGAVSSSVVAETADLSEDPDHDSGPETIRDESSPSSGIAAFPTGKVAGKCLHDILERTPFERLDASRPEDISAILRPIVEESLNAFDIPDVDRWVDTVSRAVQRTLLVQLEKGWREPADRATLDPAPPAGLRLAGLPTSLRTHELEFHFPLAGVDGAAFARAVRRDPICAGASPAIYGELEGYLKGFVDLVFQGADGRFYVVDYKSNRLGDEPSAYGREAVMADMVKHRYPLQSLLYTLALHRLLERRLPDYDPDTHLGGSFYLYLRAIDLVPDDPGAGVVWLRHDLSALLALDRAVGAGRGGEVNS